MPNRLNAIRERVRIEKGSLSYAKKRTFSGVKGFFLLEIRMFCVQPLMVGSYLYLSLPNRTAWVCVLISGLEFRNHKSIDGFDDAFLQHRNDLLALKNHRQYSNESRLHNALPKMSKWTVCTGRKIKTKVIIPNKNGLCLKLRT